MAPDLQVTKSQGVGAEFRYLHVERVAYVYDMWHTKKKIYQEN
jgi:hypothetical protein